MYFSRLVAVLKKINESRLHGPLEALGPGAPAPAALPVVTPLYRHIRITAEDVIA